MRTFSELYTETLDNATNEWVPDRKNAIDKQINEWLSEAHVSIDNITAHERIENEFESDKRRKRWRSIAYVVLYSAPQEPEAKSEKEAPEIPLKLGAGAPTVEVIKIEGGVKRRAQAMAGIFGVPEGDRLHPVDNEPAPVPVFSPDCDLTPYVDYFGNVKK